MVLSEPILAEVERNLILIHADIDPAKLTARVEMMRRFFKDQIVTGFEDDIDRQPVVESFTDVAWWQEHAWLPE